MTLMISRNMEGYMSDPSHNDGIIVTQINSKDSDAVKRILSQYGFEFKEYDVAVIEDSVPKEESLFDSTEPTDAKKKKMWIHKGKDMKKILPEELASYTSTGWKVGRK